MLAAEVRSSTQETEVTEKAQRRTFTAEYKRRIVKEADTPASTRARLGSYCGEKACIRRI